MAIITQSARLKAFAVNLFSQPIYQIVAILSTVFTMLFKLHDIIPHQPVAGRERKVHSMCGLRLKYVLYLIDMSYK